jgi:GNAT superfamily N-acetyltransferase
MTLRPATDGDRDAILDLGVAEEAAWFGEAEVSADEVGEWVDDEGGLSSGVVAVDHDGRVRGFASRGRHQALFLAEPAWTDALADELLPWLHEQRDGVELMTFAGDAARIAAFERHELRHHRSTFGLLRPESAGPLPAAEFPDGVDVARYRVGDDDEAVHRLIYFDAAWASVPGHAERALNDWREATRRCPSAFLARRGVGRALLLHAFADLQLAGARVLGLGVEAENESALGLYRSVGLEIEREWKVYASEGSAP